ncbi:MULTISPECIES: hypothetical protein [unclassified Streptomyces]|uniref:hypothetical protein n=1 Tax=unclassified Streptomyces TaxID=2593676 RepID=UPI002252FC9D|nr:MULTISPECIES: hypothetical protein [unclassified Streptomyces]MCX4987486.1 hypothetical protein [Streptomyces sp. NBC_00568]MCX5007381.1 hypothetical protein [Streptomyces sp. NBC_00638]
MSNALDDDAVRRDFDFLHGDWDVVNRRRTDFLDAESDWEEFPAVSRCWNLFGGAANIDEIDVPGQGWKGLTLRLFDAETGQWSLNWSSSRSGKLFPPVLGRFGPDGHGEFHGDDTHDGKDVRVRFVWSGISETTARWEQAFSLDEGSTWLTNWTMDFTRRKAA